MSIDESPSEILRRLEDAVTRWGEQVSESQEGLAERIARTRALVDALAGPGPDGPGPGPDADALAGSVAALGEGLDRWTDALRENSQRLAELRAEVAALREASAAGTFPVSDGSSLPPLRVNLEDLRSDLSAIRHDLRILSVLTDRVEEMRRLHEEWRQAEGASDPGVAARPPDASWTEVARLRAQLEDELDADPGGRFVSAGRIEELAYDASGSRRRMGEILVEAGVITQEQLRAALEEQERAPHRRLGFILVERGFTGETVIARVLASQLRTRFVELKDVHVDPGAAALISPRMARHHQCIPIAATVDRLTLAMANPFDLIAVDDVELASRKQVETVVATATDIRTAVDRIFGPAS